MLCEYMSDAGLDSVSMIASAFDGRFPLIFLSFSCLCVFVVNNPGLLFFCVSGSSFADICQNPAHARPNPCRPHPSTSAAGPNVSHGVQAGWPRPHAGHLGPASSSV